MEDTLVSSLPLSNGGVIGVSWIALMVYMSVTWSNLHITVKFYGKALMVKKRFLFLIHWPTMIQKMIFNDF